jgi:hypothetical protein
MIIWKGYGFLVLVIAVVLGAAVSMLFKQFGLSEDLGAGIGALIAAVAIWFTGAKLNSPAKNRTVVDKRTGQEIVLQPGHSLFFIKVQYWAFIVGAIGLLMVGSILITGKLLF